MLSRRLVTVGLAVAASGVWASSAKAMQVSPMVAEIKPSGPDSTYRMAIRNDSATPITVEIVSFRLEVDDQGSQTLGEDPGDIIAYPPQSIIPPGREQLVNVRYVGDAEIPSPKMFVVRAAQLPVRLGDAQGEAAGEGAEVKVGFNINTHVFVSPPDAEPEVRVSSVRRAENGDALISVFNAGTGIARLRRARYQLRDAAGHEVEPAASVVQLGQVSALPAGRTRELRIPAAAISGLTGEISALVRLE
jgi:fimbrial chaperone protein